ncbi:tryptophan 7-halogenase [Thalassotalea sp. 1_MG-2023]|uniref:tryptophan halogenase family protein n=1 Tax=Thalassotalea sp. 1_MG-2023 TaxID=3062680 RepID=UPI0026E489AB|nr:tryptophan halogenase family protein [Thalassotalea sp. 1_MG-2023]MDO6428811.1 tryptophan 7-halogenase [Thalassotalea sp. 1_MG-2023]
MSEPIKKVVIVGGGTAGWMSAASLGRFLEGKNIDVTIIESSALGTVGVGEATIPNIVNYNKNLGINELDLIKATQATFKLGIQFENWHKQGENFFHPFSDYGMPINNIEFHQYINQANHQGAALDIEDYCFPAVLAKKGKFAQPHPKPPTPLADYQYAFHFDAGLYANFLKDFAINLGVNHLDALINSVELNQNNGFISSVTLDNGEIVEGDLFIDCSGFKGLLIEEALHTGYEDWSQWLICDRAMAVQTELVGEPTPYTRSIAKSFGWQWRIPLQHRMGNGYIYASQFQTDDDAERTLLDSVQGATINQVRKFRFTPGRRKQVWNKNCVAIGLSSGFLEPLESTSISLIQSVIDKLLTFFPDQSFNQHDIDEVNRLHNDEVEHIRDFLILHYKATKRDDSDFWRHCQNMDIPETLAHKMALFESRGHIIIRESESFEAASWLTMYNAFGIKQKRFDERIANMPFDVMSKNLAQMKQSIENAAQQTMQHQDFIKAHCRANPE